MPTWLDRLPDDVIGRIYGHVLAMHLNTPSRDMVALKMLVGSQFDQTALGACPLRGVRAARFHLPS
jgi:hypothetical protein